MIITAYSNSFDRGVSKEISTNIFKEIKEFLNENKGMNIEISVNRRNYEQVKKLINLKNKNKINVFYIQNER